MARGVVKMRQAGVQKGGGWLGMEDSNLRYLIQSQASYR